MDALTHAVEAYVSTMATPVTDSAALMAIKLIAGNLRQAVANGQNMEARERIAYAEFLAGMASTTPVWVTSTPWPINWAAFTTFPMACAMPSCSLMSAVST